MKKKNLILKLCMIVLFFLSFSAFVSSQNHHLQGRVTDEKDKPLIGVNVVEKGTKNGTVSDLNGNFSLNVPENSTIVFSSIGFTRQEVVWDGINKLNIILLEDSKLLDEMVVTAINITREKSALTYAIQEVKNEDLTRGGSTSLINSLAGKTAGLNVSQNPGLGGSSRIVIRGETSLSGTNQPLFVVDGVPIDNTAYGSSGANVDFGTGAADIAPGNIESISVLKGANAAALYGSRAANGVILITTKKGVKNKKFSIEVNLNNSIQSILKLPEYQNEWGGGKGPDYFYVNGDGTEGGIDGQGVNFGPKLDEKDPTTPSGYKEYVQFGSPIDPATGKRIPSAWRSYPNNVRDYFNTGYTLDNNIALSGQSGDANYRISYTNMTQKGVVPNTDLKKHTYSANVSFDLGKYIKASTNISYINSGSNNIPADGYARSIMYNFVWFYRNVNIDWVKDYWLPGQVGVKQRNFETLWVNNVYFAAYENTNSFAKDRGFGNVKLDIKLLDNLSLVLRSNLDLFRDKRETRVAKGDRYTPNGQYTIQNLFFKEINNDFLLSYTLKNNSLDLMVGFGGNQRNQKFDNLTAQAPSLNVPFVYNLSNSGGEVLNNQWRSEKQVNSLYGTINLGYKSLAYLDLSARNDWSSALTKISGDSHNSYFYPSAGLSIVLNRLFQMPKFINFVKIRGNIAQVGNDTDPYQLRATFSKDNTWGGIPTVNESSKIFNSDLKPEKLTSGEVGLEFIILKSRINGDITFYKSKSVNQILSVPVAASSGYRSKIINAGRIDNWGTEVSLRGKLIDTKDVLWELGVNWANSKSKIIELAEGVDTYILFGDGRVTVEAREGGYMGDMYGLVMERSPEGELIFYNGLPRLAPEKVKIGNYNPDWKAGIISNFSYKGFSVSLLFDYQKGGDIYSFTTEKGIHAGTLVGSAEKGNTRIEGIIGEGVKLENGTYVKNDVKAPAFDFVRRSMTAANVNTFDATYLKLKEVNISYKIPSKISSLIHAESASIGLFGNNLFLWTKVPHIDPDNVYQTGGVFKPGIEMLQLPSNRTTGIQLRLTF